MHRGAAAHQTAAPRRAAPTAPPRTHLGDHARVRLHVPPAAAREEQGGRCVSEGMHALHARRRRPRLLTARPPPAHLPRMPCSSTAVGGAWAGPRCRVHRARVPCTCRCARCHSSAAALEPCSFARTAPLLPRSTCTHARCIERSARTSSYAMPGLSSSKSCGRAAARHCVARRARARTRALPAAAAVVMVAVRTAASAAPPAPAGACCCGAGMAGTAPIGSLHMLGASAAGSAPTTELSERGLVSACVAAALARAGRLVVTGLCRRHCGDRAGRSAAGRLAAGGGGATRTERVRACARPAHACMALLAGLQQLAAAAAGSSTAAHRAGCAQQNARILLAPTSPALRSPPPPRCASARIALQGGTSVLREPAAARLSQRA